MTSDVSKYMELLRKTCLGNVDALSFLVNWNVYCHAADDIIDDMADGKPVSAERVIALTVHACALYTLPFYQTNASRLQPVSLMVSNMYADSVAWERSKHAGEATMADVLRFAGNEMNNAVALICGGYEHMRAMSAAFRSLSWASHHDEASKPI